VPSESNKIQKVSSESNNTDKVLSESNASYFAFRTFYRLTNLLYSIVVGAAVYQYSRHICQHFPSIFNKTNFPSINSWYAPAAASGLRPSAISPQMALSQTLFSKYQTGDKLVVADQESRNLRKELPIRIV
jgi:hypothetical protein